MITNDARSTRGIKCGAAMVKAALHKKKAVLTSKLDSNIRNKMVESYIWIYSFVSCWNLDTSESGSEIAGKF